VRFGFKTNLQDTTWADLLAVWRAADDVEPFESGWVFDDFYSIFSDSTGPCLEGWTTPPALAQATRRLRVGVMVSGIVYRHPGVLPNIAATLDIISDGRLELGLGAAGNEEECDAYGIALGSLKERFDRFDEDVEVVTRLLRDTTTTFEDRYYKLRDARCEPKPISGTSASYVLLGLLAFVRFALAWADPLVGFFAAGLALDGVPDAFFVCFATASATADARGPAYCSITLKATSCTSSFWATAIRVLPPRRARSLASSPCSSSSRCPVSVAFVLASLAARLPASARSPVRASIFILRSARKSLIAPTSSISCARRLPVARSDAVVHEDGLCMDRLCMDPARSAIWPIRGPEDCWAECLPCAWVGALNPARSNRRSDRRGATAIGRGAPYGTCA
jgi:hypothetical protein